MDFKNLGISLVAILIAIGAWFHGGSTIVKQLGAAVACGGNTTCLVGDLYLTADFVLGGTNISNALHQQVTSGSCASGTSTLFAIANPFTSGTSTASIEMLTGTGQATSTTFSVGTTTKSTGLALTDISPTLVNGGVAATTTNFSMLSGQSTNLGTGQVSSGSNTLSKIVVGPSELIGAFGTSTATGAGAANYTPGITCTYKVKWTN